MTPKSRTDLKNYCLRALGSPLVKINIDDTQIDDRIDDAIEFFRLYHYDGIETVYLKHEITQADIDNQYIPISPLVYGVVNVFNMPAGSSSGNMFGPQYQMRLNDLNDLSSTTMSYYSMAMQHIQTVDHVLNGHIMFDFNRLLDKLNLHINWANDVKVGNYILVEAYRVLDPNEYTSMWGEPWFRAYCIALFKIQWATNLQKFANMQLPGGISFDSQTIMQQGMDEKQRLEDDLISKLAPLNMFIG